MSTRASRRNGERPQGTQSSAGLRHEPSAMPEGPDRERHQTAAGKQQGNCGVPFELGQPIVATCSPLRSQRHNSAAPAKAGDQSVSAARRPINASSAGHWAAAGRDGS